MPVIFPLAKGDVLPFEPLVNSRIGGVFYIEKKFKFTVRLTEKEKCFLEEKTKFLNISKNKFFRNAIYLDEKKLDILNDNFIETVKLARYISNNLNQIAKKVNSDEHLKDGFDFVKRLEELWQSLKR